MTTILCYGDSNTYGYNPVNGLRYPKDVRWTGVLQKLLGEQQQSQKKAVMEEQQFLKILPNHGKQDLAI